MYVENEKLGKQPRSLSVVLEYIRSSLILLVTPVSNLFLIYTFILEVGGPNLSLVEKMHI